MVLGKQRTAGCAFLLSCSFLICAGYDGDLDIQMSFEEDPLFIVLDECVREYINHRVASQSITLKAEHYALVTAGAGQVFYGDDVTLEATWANFYVQILQSLEYETEFMEYLSSESNKRLVLGVYASRREHEEANILGVFISCLLENQFHSARSYEEEHGAGSHLPPGQIKELDVFVKKYMEERVAGHRIMRRIEQIVAELDPRRKKDCPWAAYYVKVLEKVEEHGPAYIRSEHSRFHKDRKKKHRMELKILNSFLVLLSRQNAELVEIKQLVTQTKEHDPTVRILLSISCISCVGWLYLTCCHSEGGSKHGLCVNVEARNGTPIARSPRRGRTSPKRSPGGRRTQDGGQRLF